MCRNYFETIFHREEYDKGYRRGVTLAAILQWLAVTTATVTLLFRSRLEPPRAVLKVQIRNMKPQLNGKLSCEIYIA